MVVFNISLLKKKHLSQRFYISINQPNQLIHEAVFYINMVITAQVRGWQQQTLKILTCADLVVDLEVLSVFLL